MAPRASVENLLYAENIYRIGSRVAKGDLHHHHHHHHHPSPQLWQNLFPQTEAQSPFFSFSRHEIDSNNQKRDQLRLLTLSLQPFKAFFVFFSIQIVISILPLAPATKSCFEGVLPFPPPSTISGFKQELISSAMLQFQKRGNGFRQRLWWGVVFERVLPVRCKDFLS